ncbi:D-methionine transport system ATP-binding protein [Paenibacillus uliginis N3/975]|uniref:D-methionine transport system ATP-binding protein n=1 Tax=Paenibacillus uliginis N3/975 TaxID=1313296 RepID=A0A1X7HP78_9BACL|nr:methionine ABC transporter ATP-binding protein [Paenibacillus uliginis]SMF89716.1 D-methionine transport system ATP-binding protein [Paenibacillus uliginis N3/975]
MISLQQVSKSFGPPNNRFLAVDSVTLSIEEGNIHGIIGASGAGKSTLLRLMNVLERPDSGRVIVDKRDLTGLGNRQLREARRSIGMIFQHFNLISNRTVGGNIVLPLELAGVPKKERLNRMEEYLHFVGLWDKVDQYPAQLSGGQKQRVAIARALANRPRVLLCDEPTSALDSVTTSGILDVLRHVNERFGVTVVMVTHEMNVVNRICSHVSVMDNGQLTETNPVEVHTND